MQIDIRWKLLREWLLAIPSPKQRPRQRRLLRCCCRVFLPSVCHLQVFRVSSLLVFPHHHFLSRPFMKIRSYQRPFTIFSLRVDMQIEMRFWLCQRKVPSGFSAFWLPPLFSPAWFWLFMAPKWPQTFQLSLWVAVSHSPGSFTK